MMSEATNSMAPCRSRPNTRTFCQTLKPSAVTRPMAQITRAAMTAAFLRDMLLFSTRKAVGGSSSEIDEVQAATNSRPKKAIAYGMPKGMSLKASGSEVKIRPGPPPAGSRPKANSTGKIARPASSAMAVSMPATVTATRGMEMSRGR